MRNHIHLGLLVRGNFMGMRFVPRLRFVNSCWLTDGALPAVYYYYYYIITPADAERRLAFNIHLQFDTGLYTSIAKSLSEVDMKSITNCEKIDKLSRNLRRKCTL